MHLLLWTVLTNVFLDFLHVELVIFFYHSFTCAIPSMCNLKLKKCSINIIQTLHSVCIHIEDVHLLLWADLKIFFIYFLYAELRHFFITICHGR